MRLAILLSGRGSNFAAIHDAIARGVLDAEIVAVISNRPDAPGIARARQLFLPSYTIDHKKLSADLQKPKTLDARSALNQKLHQSAKIEVL